jgi:hypothetical protein
MADRSGYPLAPAKAVIGESLMMTALLTPRLTRLAMLAASGLVAGSVAACGSSNHRDTGQPATSPGSTSAAPTTTPPPPPPVGHDHIEGLVDSVSDNTIRLTQRDRTAATVDFTPQTMVTELTPAQLPDVTSGSCVDVDAGPTAAPPGGAITAKSVTISPAVGGRCPPPPGEPADSPGAYGMVDSVTGDTIAVTTTDPAGTTSRTTVTVTDTTTYTKHAVTNAQAIQQGKCLAAQGTTDGGVLHAATIDLEPCPPMGRPRHHFHIPYIPHHHH